eukprot:SAG22_NODE_478_length_9967_cov_12.777260_11_plen_278_part_00
MAPRFAPIRALGVEVFGAGFVSVPALLNNTWRSGLLPLAEYAVKYNWTGIHVDFEEGTAGMRPGLASEQLYAYFLSTLAPVMKAHNLQVEVDVGEVFPVQDIKSEVMRFYLDALAVPSSSPNVSGPDGKLALMGPTYYNAPPGQNRSKDTIMALKPPQHRDWTHCGGRPCGGNPSVNAMFGIALDEAHAGAAVNQAYGWKESDFTPMLAWVREQGICEISIYTSPEGNSGVNNSWSRFVAPWMLDVVAEFLTANCSCVDCDCTNCSKALSAPNTRQL